MNSSEMFRRAASFFPAGVAVVAGQTPAGERFAHTASGFSAVSFDPPLVSFCVRRESPATTLLTKARPFSVSALRAGESDFAKRLSEPLNDSGDWAGWSVSPHGPPILDSALFSLDCSTLDGMDAGDYRMVIGSVQHAIVQGGSPLVSWRRAYYALHLEYPFLKSAATLDDFVEAWEQCRLQGPAFTHGAHVATCAYYAFNYENEVVFARMKAGLPRFNVSVGGQNTDTSGYHETLTKFWALTIGGFVRSRQFDSRYDAVRAAVAEFGEDRDLHRLYYAFDVARDVRARREWVEPDRSFLR